MAAWYRAKGLVINLSVMANSEDEAIDVIEEFLSHSVAFQWSVEADLDAAPYEGPTFEEEAWASE